MWLRSDPVIDKNKRLWNWPLENVMRAISSYMPVRDNDYAWIDTPAIGLIDTKIN